VTSPSVRILVCDADPAFATELRAYLEHDPAIRVEAPVAGVESLRARIEDCDPDLVIVDLALPNGAVPGAIEQIMRERPLPILVLDAACGSERAAEALAAGALEVATKSSLRLSEPGDLWATALRSRIKRLATVRVRRTLPAPAAAAAPPPPTAVDRVARAIGIGASTGGPPALASLLAELPADFAIPILVVQHIAPGFTDGLVSWLDDRVALPVRVATRGATARPGIWFAPDDAHLGIDPALRFTLDATTRHGAHRPSVDMLFLSLARAAGGGAVGLVLTGMGRDGADGVAQIRADGGLVIAQDEASSAVFGMPRAAIAAGADVVLPLAAIGAALRALRSLP
jgi:two-component system chemotaxis response regulator CheB